MCEIFGVEGFVVCLLQICLKYRGVLRNTRLFRELSTREAG